MKLQKKAFTLVELIVVIAILAILAVTSFTVLTKWFNKARDSKRMAAVADIKGSIERYISDPNHPNFSKDVHDKMAGKGYGTDDTDNKIITVVVDDTFLGEFPGLDLQKAPKDPLVDTGFRLGTKYEGNSTNMFDVAATLEFQGDEPTANAYVQGTFKEGALGLTGFKGLVVEYNKQAANTPGTSGLGSGNYVYNGSTDNLLPYTFD